MGSQCSPLAEFYLQTQQHVSHFLSAVCKALCTDGSVAVERPGGDGIHAKLLEAQQGALTDLLEET